MAKNREALIDELVTTLSRVRVERPNTYRERLVHYVDMRDGGDGGPWRKGAETSLRELHYKGWLDGDFQTVLERLGETPTLDEAARAERFAHEASLWTRLRSKLRRKPTAEEPEVEGDSGEA